MREVNKVRPLTIITIIISLIIVLLVIIKPLLAEDLNNLPFNKMHRQTLTILDTDNSITRNSNVIDSISKDDNIIIEDYNIDRAYSIVEDKVDQQTIDKEIEQYNNVIENNKILNNNIMLISIALLIVNLILIAIDRFA